MNGEIVKNAHYDFEGSYARRFPKNDSLVKCVVPVSGGKDSQASLQLALTVFKREEIRGLFCDTGFEHPITYAHVFFMQCFYGVRIDTVCGGNVLQKSIKHGRFPGGGARHCTEELKIWETKYYCKKLAEAQGSRIASKKHKIIGSDSGGFEVWYGMRSDESPEREKRYHGKVGEDLYNPHEVLAKYPKYLGKMGVRFRLCILEWSERERCFLTYKECTTRFIRTLIELVVFLVWRPAMKQKKKLLRMTISDANNIEKL